MLWLLDFRLGAALEDLSSCDLSMSALSRVGGAAPSILRKSRAPTKVVDYPFEDEKGCEDSLLTQGVTATQGGVSFPDVGCRTPDKSPRCHVPFSPSEVRYSINLLLQIYLKCGCNLLYFSVLEIFMDFYFFNCYLDHSVCQINKVLANFLLDHLRF